MRGAHPILPRPGTAYTMEGMNTGLPAILTNAMHYPVEAVCTGCGQVIRCEYMLPLGPGTKWKHTGRRPGETAPGVGSGLEGSA